MVNKERMNVWMHLLSAGGGKALWSPAGGLKEALLEEASLKTGRWQVR